MPVSGQCAVTAAPTQVRAEGLTERVGDILLQCTGSTPGAVLAGNLSVYLPVSVTNRVDANNLTRDAVLSVDYGSGFVPTGVAGLVTNQIIAFNGISITVPPSGNLNLKISNIRAAVNQLGTVSPRPVQAQLIFGTPTSIPINQTQPIVAYPQTGLFATLYTSGITCIGSPLPSTIDMANLFAAGTILASTRLTEGFASSFQPKQPGEDNGVRFLAKYSGFPANARIYVPDMVAGSTALAPTSGGDLGVPRSIGQYVPGSNSLLLVRVVGADANGAGGFPLAPPTGPAVLNSVSEVPLSGGSGYAVYEVVDSSVSRLESAQFPTFIGISDITANSVAQETITLAPASTSVAASTSAPILRFSPVPPTSDCGTLGDCSATYRPKLVVDAQPIQLTGVAGGAMTGQPGYIAINNAGGGLMPWTATVNYAKGTGWLNLDYTSGVNNGSVRTFAITKDLTAGTYQANVVVDAGAAGGGISVPVTLTVSAPTPPPPPPPVQTPTVTVTDVVNAATFDKTPLVAGSIGTVKGTNLAGNKVTVTFDGLPAQLLYTSATQINLVVPDGVASKTSSSMVVSVDGISSSPTIVALAPAWPAIFSNGILNQDTTSNAADHAASMGSVIAIWGTGIPTGATVSVQIGERRDLVPAYAGPAPELPGVQQVNVTVPDGLASGTNPIVICAKMAGQQSCSAGYPLTVQ